MKGLLIKDMYTLRHYALWYLIYCLVFMLLAVLLENPAFITGLAVFLPLSAVSATVTADRKDNWTEYALACGQSPLTIAAQKMIVATALSLITTALWALSYFIVFRSFDNPAELCLTAALSFVTVALALPLSYKLGVERSRLILGIIMLVLLIACVALFTAVGDGLSDVHPLLFSVLTAAGAASCVPSLFITASVIRPDKSSPHKD